MADVPSPTSSLFIWGKGKIGVGSCLLTTATSLGFLQYLFLEICQCRKECMGQAGRGGEHVCSFEQHTA